LGLARLKASDNAWGLNTGFLAQLSDAVRIGVAYRSALSYTLAGHATFSAGAGSYDSGARTPLTVPENVAFQLYGQLSPRTSVTASATWTRWSRLDTLLVTRSTASLLGATGSVVADLPFHWRDTWAVAAGISSQLDSRWKIRVGVADDPATSNDVDRSPRLPDQHRIYLGAGTTIHISRAGTIDIAYAHAFFKDAGVSATVPGVPGSLNGTFGVAADVVSMQYTLAL